MFQHIFMLYKCVAIDYDVIQYYFLIIILFIFNCEGNMVLFMLHFSCYCSQNITKTYPTK